MTANLFGMTSGLRVCGMALIKRATSSGTQVRYPLYDSHGNSVGTLGRPATSTGLPSVGDERGYDAWGRVRSGLATGAPSARYCASLGHVQDDESGLVYMRARYYEPGTGRFVSEDDQRQSGNWYSYCSNDPVNHVDETGHAYEYLAANFIKLLKMAMRIMMSPSASIIRKVKALEAIQKQLQGIADMFLTDAQQLAEQAEVDEATAGLEGDLGAMEQEIADMEMGTSCVFRTESTVYMIGRKMIDIMIEMVLDDL